MGYLTELDKQREIVFSPIPEGQLYRALLFLRELGGCSAETLPEKQHTVRVSYNLNQYSLEELESQLTEAGFHLERSVLRNIERNIIYYCEDTIRHNMDVPVHPTKKNEREVFVKAYEHESHGDVDDSPPEISNFK